MLLFFLQWPIEIDRWIEHSNKKKEIHQHTHRWSYKKNYDQLLLLYCYNSMVYIINEDTKKNWDIAFICMWFVPPLFSQLLFILDMVFIYECVCVDWAYAEHVQTFLAHLIPSSLCSFLAIGNLLFSVFARFLFPSHFWNIHRLWICNHFKRRWVWCHFYSRYWRMRE